MRVYPRMAKMNHAPSGCPAVFGNHSADFGVGWGTLDGVPLMRNKKIRRDFASVLAVLPG